MEQKVQELKEYTESLEQMNNEYEGRINLMKEKEGKIKRELIVIEE
jgi:hypothetical protein